MKCRWKDGPVVQWGEAVSADMEDSCSGALSHILQNICSNDYITLRMSLDFIYFISVCLCVHVRKYNMYKYELNLHYETYKTSDFIYFCRKHTCDISFS